MWEAKLVKFLPILLNIHWSDLILLKARFSIDALNLTCHCSDDCLRPPFSLFKFQDVFVIRIQNQLKWTQAFRRFYFSKRNPFLNKFFKLRGYFRYLHKNFSSRSAFKKAVLTSYCTILLSFFAAKARSNLKISYLVTSE